VGGGRARVRAIFTKLHVDSIDRPPTASTDELAEPYANLSLAVRTTESQQVRMAHVDNVSDEELDAPTAQTILGDLAASGRLTQRSSAAAHNGMVLRGAST